jgi:hypothetical protein
MRVSHGQEGGGHGVHHAAVQGLWGQHGLPHRPVPRIVQQELAAGAACVCQVRLCLNGRMKIEIPPESIRFDWKCVCGRTSSASRRGIAQNITKTHTHTHTHPTRTLTRGVVVRAVRARIVHIHFPVARGLLLRSGRRHPPPCLRVVWWYCGVASESLRTYAAGCMCACVCVCVLAGVLACTSHFTSISRSLKCASNSSASESCSHPDPPPVHVQMASQVGHARDAKRITLSTQTLL